MDTPLIYRGRFAPSPTGPLHFGSLIAAVGSYLDAKHHHGEWLIRMEDLDRPRCSTAAAQDILRTLDRFGLRSDAPLLHQSSRDAAYETAFQALRRRDLVYPCCCTRKEIADSSQHGIDGQVYPGSCRNGMPAGREGRAWRVLTNEQPVIFDDELQGHISQNLTEDVGDFVIKRADGLFAYQLAVVVDDAAQGITHVVRGCDLLASTPRQIHLQRLLDLPTPRYMHLPVATNQTGEKLSKQTLAHPVSTNTPVATTLLALRFLRQNPPEALQLGSLDEVLTWAIRHWQPDAMRHMREQKSPLL